MKVNFYEDEAKKGKQKVMLITAYCFCFLFIFSSHALSKFLWGKKISSPLSLQCCTKHVDFIYELRDYVFFWADYNLTDVLTICLAPGNHLHNDGKAAYLLDSALTIIGGIMQISPCWNFCEYHFSWHRIYITAN